MKEVTVSCIAFMYSCVRGHEPHPVLIKSILDFLVGGRLLIILTIPR